MVVRRVRLPPAPILKPLFHHNANPLALTYMLPILIFYHFFILFLLNSTDYTAILQATYGRVIYRETYIFTVKVTWDTTFFF